MKLRLVIFLLFPLLFSCTSSPGRGSVINLEEAAVRHSKRYLSQQDPVRALAAIYGYRQKGLEGENLESLWEEGIALLEARFSQLLEEGDYPGAYALSQSFVALNIPVPSEPWGFEEYCKARAEQEMEKGNQISALVFINEIVNSTILSPQDLKYWGDIAFQAKWAQLLDRIIINLNNLKTSFPEEWRELSNKKESPSDLLRGTVTVWVNRGIRIQGGMGMPDRVIGSGFFIDTRGYLLTNYHVIDSEVNPTYEGFSRLYIRLSGDPYTRIPARVVGYDKIMDLALLKTEIEAPYTFPLFSEDTFKPGDRIYAIGSPLGLESTITSGIISAVNRRFLQLGDTIQVDVPINRGNSGGPLFNEAGTLVGIVFAGIEHFEGLNFAIPAQWFVPLIPQLYTEGAVTHSWLGFAVSETQKGLEIIYKMPGEILDGSGLRMGDTISALNGKQVKTLRDTQKLVMTYPPGTLLRIDYTRGEEELFTYVVVEARPENPILEALKKDSRENVITPLFGMALEPVGSPFWKKAYSVSKVVKGSIAEETGISESDPLTILNWQVDEKEMYAAIQIFIKKKKAGFMETAIQLAAYLEIDNFI